MVVLVDKLGLLKELLLPDSGVLRCRLLSFLKVQTTIYTYVYIYIYIHTALKHNVEMFVHNVEYACACKLTEYTDRFFARNQSRVQMILLKHNTSAKILYWSFNLLLG